MLGLSFSGFAQASVSFTISDQSVSPSSSTQFFVNNNLVIQTQATDVASYQVTITDNHNTIVANTGQLTAVAGAVPDIPVFDWCDGTVASCTSIPNTTLGDYTITVSITDIYSSSASYSGMVTLSYPTTSPAVAAFTLNGQAVSPYTSISFNGPATLNANATTSTGDIATYRYDIYDETEQNLLGSSGDIYGTPIAAGNDLFTCDGGTDNCIKFSNSNVGNFVVRLTMSSLCPQDPFASIAKGKITINPAVTAPADPPVASFTINDRDVSNLGDNTPIYTCSSGLVLHNTSTGQANFTKVDIYDEQGATLLYSTGYQATSAQVNLFNQSWPVSASTPFNAAIGGTFRIKVSVSDVNYDNVFANASWGLIPIIPGFVYTNPTLLVSSVRSSTNDQVDYMTVNTPATAGLVGRSSTVFSLTDVRYNKIYLSDYTLTLSEWDETANDWKSPVWSQNFTNPSTGLTGYMVPITIIGGSGFFDNTTNAPDGSKWKLNAVLHNQCEQTSLDQVFEIYDATFQ